MRGFLHGVSPLWQTFVLLTLLVSVTVAAAPGNVLAHALEKIYLWEIYNMICDADGPDRNNKILPFQNGGVDNRGRGPGNRLDFEEFIYHVNGKGVLTKDATFSPTLKPPPEGGDIIDVARNINNKLLGGKLKPSVINRQLGSTSGSGKDTDTGYRNLMKQAALWGQQYRDSGGSKDRLTRMQFICDAVHVVRDVDYRTYIAKDLADTARGFGLDSKDLVTHEQLLPFEETRKYNALYLAETLAKPSVQNTLKQNGKTPQDVMDWANNYGDKGPGGNSPGRDYSDASITHFKTKEMWKDNKAKVFGKQC